MLEKLWSDFFTSDLRGSLGLPEGPTMTGPFINRLGLTWCNLFPLIASL